MFRMRWGDRTVAGFSRVHAPPVGTEDPFTLEAGRTFHAGFEEWAATGLLLPDPTDGQGAGLVRDVALDQVDEAGKVASTYEVWRTWVSEFQALPDLDAGANAVAIQHLKLENQGWRLHRPGGRRHPDGQRLV